MSEQNVYEMLWDCKFCGTKKLLGKSQKFCPVCGAAQDPATRYFPSDDEKVAVKDHQYVGADLICPSCGSPNSGNAEYCTQCGAPLTKAARAQTLEAQERREGEKFESSGPRDVAKERMDADLKRAADEESARRAQARRPFIIGGVIVAVVAVIALVAFLFSTRATTVIVTGRSWERTIQIQDYQPRSGSDWRNSVPGDAYNLTCRQEVRSYKQVPDGQECTTRRVDQGDGTFKEERDCKTKYRDEPVYDSKCSYTVDRWQDNRMVTAKSDNISEAPYWPETNITNSGTNCYGCEREGARNERYVVHLKETNGDKTFDCPFDQAKWESIGVESVWEMDVRRVGSPVCDSLKQGS